MYMSMAAGLAALKCAWNWTAAVNQNHFQLCVQWQMDVGRYALCCKNEDRKADFAREVI